MYGLQRRSAYKCLREEEVIYDSRLVLGSQLRLTSGGRGRLLRAEINSA